MRKKKSTHKPETTATTAMGTALLEPPSPTSGEESAPKTKDVTPSSPEALPAPPCCEAMAREKLVVVVMPMHDTNTKSAPVMKATGRCSTATTAMHTAATRERQAPAQSSVLSP